MATVAIPKRPRPHQPEPQKSANESRKLALIDLIARGDLHGAEAIRQEIRAEQQEIASRAGATDSANGEMSFARWRDDQGDIEIVEMTATPEAQAYFAAVMAKERR